MKIFISSLIAGYEDMLAAAVAAARSLDYDPITAETFDVGLTSRRISLAAVRPHYEEWIACRRPIDIV